MSFKDKKWKSGFHTIYLNSGHKKVCLLPLTKGVPTGGHYRYPAVFWLGCVENCPVGTKRKIFVMGKLDKNLVEEVGMENKVGYFEARRISPEFYENFKIPHLS